MPETVETTGAGTSPQEDETSKYASLLATGEHVLLVRQRHWLTFLEAGRWFVLALGAGIVVLVLDQSVPDDGIVGFLGTLLDWGFWICLTIGLLGVGWYFLAWRVERYLVTTRRVIEAGGVINKYTRDTSLQMITDMIVGHPWLGRIVGCRAAQQAVAAASAPQPAPAPVAPQAPARLSVDELDSSLSRLADLRDRGLITPEEFDEKKRELLDRH